MVVSWLIASGRRAPVYRGGVRPGRCGRASSTVGLRPLDVLLVERWNATHRVWRLHRIIIGMTHPEVVWGYGSWLPRVHDVDRAAVE